MNKDVYIIHDSAIVQNGLECILNKSFRCSVYCVSNLPELNIDFFNKNQLFIIDFHKTNTTEFRNFRNNLKYTNSVVVITDNLANAETNDFVFLCYNCSQKEVVEKLKPLLTNVDLNNHDIDGLSNREIDVLKLVAVGLSNKEIADKLFISIHTVMSHRKNITEKLGIKSISGLTVYAIINKYIDTSNADIKGFI